jgi:Flp pilus assembly pilin Flp
VRGKDLKIKLKDCKGQSVAEYAVLLALVLIVATAVLIGMGRGSSGQLANVNSAFANQSGHGIAPSAARTAGGAATP